MRFLNSVAIRSIYETNRITTQQEMYFRHINRKKEPINALHICNEDQWYQTSISLSTSSWPLSTRPIERYSANGGSGIGSACKLKQWMQLDTDTRILRLDRVVEEFLQASKWVYRADKTHNHYRIFFRDDASATQGEVDERHGGINGWSACKLGSSGMNSVSIYEDLWDVSPGEG